MKDLEPGMVLEGTVTNVTNFGAFVDIGVHQDGLVHISALANRYIKNPHEVVKAGDIVQIKVIEVDIPRKRIALSMRMSDESGSKESGSTQRTENKKYTDKKKQPQKKQPNQQKTGTLGELFSQALKKS